MSAQKSILIVDDDQALRQSLAEQLHMYEEFAASEAATGRAALDAVKTGRFDLILLDIGLPDMDGREICKLLRRSGIAVPIIMLTAADSEADTILGLDSGANDYVTKPFRLGALLARIRAQLRQHEHSEDATFTIGQYTFKPASKLLVRPNGTGKIRLTEKEAAILKYLYRARDRGHLPRGAAERGVGLQRQRRNSHAGNAHLPAAPEDRARALRPPPAGDRGRRLPTGLVTATPPGVAATVHRRENP